MERIGEVRLENQLPSGGKRFFDYIEEAKQRLANDPRTPAQRQRDEINEEKGWLDSEEYDCKKCNNRGFIPIIKDDFGCEHVAMCECECMDIRRAIRRMKKSGLDRVIRKYTLEKFVVRDEWQRAMAEAARKYIDEGLEDGRWFFAGGQSGSGKTHICTAIAREALYKYPVAYMMWEEESKKLKAAVNEGEEYRKLIKPFKEVKVLYIDDLFKPTWDDAGKPRKPTAADIRLAFEIINYRYVKRNPTVISSEWYMDALADIDEATASRIAERCGEFQIVIGRDRGKNWRFRGRNGGLGIRD